MALIDRGYVSADGHVVEPGDLWTTRLDRKFRDRAPRVESRQNGDYYLIDGFDPLPVGLEGVALDDKISGTIKSAEGYRHANTRPGAWDPQARLADQDVDSVRAEVIYPGLGLFISSAPNEEYVYACLRAYNDWLSEFCGAAPTRLLGAALLPMRGPVEWAIAEAERAATRVEFRDDSYRGLNRSYGERNMLGCGDCTGLGIIMTLHVGTDDPYAEGRSAGNGQELYHSKFVPCNGRWRISFGAVPQHYPQLRFVLSTGGKIIITGWSPAIEAPVCILSASSGRP
jgi:predicted TIM-barrel fold metal-dependent hydrolase